MVNSVSQGELQAAVQLTEDLTCIFCVRGGVLSFGIHLSLEPVLNNLLHVIKNPAPFYLFILFLSKYQK